MPRSVPVLLMPLTPFVLSTAPFETVITPALLARPGTSSVPLLTLSWPPAALVNTFASTDCVPAPALLKGPSFTIVPTADTSAMGIAPEDGKSRGS